MKIFYSEICVLHIFTFTYISPVSLMKDHKATKRLVYIILALQCFMKGEEVNKTYNGLIEYIN